jgi:hypothetical protein
VIEKKPDPQLPQARAPEAALVPEWARQLSRLLDSAIRVPGTDLSFGLDPLIGALLPEAGDAISALLSLALLVVAYRQRVPKAVLGRMLVNIGLDALLGAIPVLGDAFDFAFKANTKNLELIEKHSRNPELPATAGDRLVVLAAALVVVALGALPILVTYALIKLVVASIN